MRRNSALASNPFGIFLIVMEPGLEGVSVAGPWLSGVLFGGAGLLLALTVLILLWPQPATLALNVSARTVARQPRWTHKRLRILVAVAVGGFFVTTVGCVAIGLFVNEYVMFAWFGVLMFGATILGLAQVTVEWWRRLGIHD